MLLRYQNIVNIFLNNYLIYIMLQPQLGIQLIDGRVIDDMIYCKIRRNPVTTINDRTFDLINDMYYLLVAAGSGADRKFNFS